MRSGSVNVRSWMMGEVVGMGVYSGCGWVERMRVWA